MENNQILFDNWGISYATTLLDMSTQGNLYYETPRIQNNKGEYFRNKFIGEKEESPELLMSFSLNKFIESLILFDDINYVKRNSSTWDYDTGVEKSPIYKYLKKITISDEEYNTCSIEARKILETKPFNNNERYSSIVTEGALRYLMISKSFNVNYSPSPFRADFISKYGINLLSSTKSNIIKYIDKESKKLIDAFHKELGFEVFEIEVPPITNFILNEAVDLKSIPSLICQVRESDEAIEFRNWLKEFDTIINNGDVVLLKNKLNEVNELLNSFRKLFHSDDMENGQIEIGLSPSISLPFSSFLKIKDIFKPVQLVFLKKIVSHMFQHRNYSKNLNRLFDLNRFNIS